VFLFLVPLYTPGGCGTWRSRPNSKRVEGSGMGVARKPWRVPSDEAKRADVQEDEAQRDQTAKHRLHRLTSFEIEE